MSDIGQGGHVTSATVTTVATGGTLALNDYLMLLSDNVALIGVFVAAASLLVQFTFSLIGLRLQIKKLDLDQRENIIVIREKKKESKTPLILD